MHTFVSLQYEKNTNREYVEDEKIWDESPPPPYESDLFGQIKEAKESSEGSFDFCKRVFQLFAGTSKYTLAFHFTCCTFQVSYNKQTALMLHISS